jgi:hypothetical protein
MNSNSARPAFGQAIAMLALFLGFQSALCVPLVVVSMAWHRSLTVDAGFLVVPNALAMVPTLWLGSIICKRPWRQLIVFGPMPWRLLPAVILMAAGGFILCSEVDNITRMILPMPALIAEVLGKVFKWCLSFFHPEITGLVSKRFDQPQFQPWWLDAGAAVVLTVGFWLLRTKTQPPIRAAVPAELPPIIAQA